MKKIIFIFFTILFCSLTCYAETALDDVDTTDYTHTTQNLKYFSEKDYQQALEMYKNKFQKPKKIKKKDIKTPTTPFADNVANPEYKILDDIINHKGAIMIPTMCQTSTGQKIYPGHYSLEYSKDQNDNEWLILSQGLSQKIKIATEKSQASADEKTINYAYAIGKDDVIKLLYGNIDVCVEATLQVIN